MFDKSICEKKKYMFEKNRFEKIWSENRTQLDLKIY